MTKVIVAALYHFTKFSDYKKLQDPLRKICNSEGIKGSLLIAYEGINGTISGSRSGIDAVLKHIRSMPGCSNLEHKESFASEIPFKRMKVKLKKEIVTMGQPHIDPTLNVGNYIEPSDWNNLISQNDVILIDTRNDYEVAIGSFDGAIDPETKSFGEFPEWWEENRSKYQDKRVAMFCTGGIRCEKSTNFLLNEGVKDVYHLKGGILKYLEEVPEKNSKWNGECFVFDSRVSVKHGLEEGIYNLCYACRMPLAPDDFKKEEFEKGVSCHLCIDSNDDERKERFRERQYQVELADKRGKHHIG
ncbi:rhodanese-related sulfurtransferase [Amylibacter sp.]|nr:rhodanese-related sulfurtransferase [Amylibacter sp.]MDA9910823.1 rhodanese-related sulfurtransferase [Amylibacter sp.]MDB0000939.1 rhodanese-related sulfurtransferase [Amylibacter sp.]MDB4007984.1 rhodanese-related sulfurtransferase [Amylibacter sp.]MDB4071372.1 rhodanese-related sulfurtransferase [Amylibacter sp.]